MNFGEAGGVIRRHLINKVLPISGFSYNMYIISCEIEIQYIVFHMLVLIGRSEASQNGIREKYQNGKAMFCVFFYH